MAYDKRIKPKVLNWYASLPNSFFKFVIQNEQDLQDARTAVMKSLRNSKSTPVPANQQAGMATWEFTCSVQSFVFIIFAIARAPCAHPPTTALPCGTRMRWRRPGECCANDATDQAAAEPQPLTGVATCLVGVSFRSRNGMKAEARGAVVGTQMWPDGYHRPISALSYGPLNVGRKELHMRTS